MKTSRWCVACVSVVAAVVAPAAMAAEAKTQPTQEAKRAQSTPTGAQQPPAPKPDAAESPKEPAAATRVDLDATQITGNRELPRVLYVVPWKRADLGEMSGKPAKSLLDEVLAPVDRDVFRRQNRYHDALQTEAAAPSADAPKGER